jgi:hypothetical protein
MLREPSMSLRPFDVPSTSAAPADQPEQPVVQAESGKVPYEPPSLTLAGNLCNLLGKSGANRDFTYKNTNAGRP